MDTIPTDSLSWLARLRIYLYKRRVRKTKEQLAYWSSAAETYRGLCSRVHPEYEREYMVKARAKRDLYRARLNHLMENNCEDHSL